MFEQNCSPLKINATYAIYASEPVMVWILACIVIQSLLLIGEKQFTLANRKGSYK